MTDIQNQFAEDNPGKLRWAFINEGKVEPQSDDRPPMIAKLESVARGATSSAASRSGARRKHQAMYKEWSRKRHD